MQSVKYGRQIAYVGLTFLLCLSNSFAQRYGNKFIIAPNYYANAFSIDRTGQEVYFSFYLGTIYRLDLKSGDVMLTSMHGTSPIFSNKQHLMIHGDTLYDIGKGTSYTLTAPPESTGNTYGGLPPYFSPNDSNLMWTWQYGAPYQPNPNREFIFSLKDSTFTPVDSTVWPYFISGALSSVQWSSDTSFVYAASESCMVEYFIHSRRIDTLITLHSYDQISSFAYNTKKNILAYSWYPGYVTTNTRPLIYFHYRDSSSDLVV